jgi:hypothetical protein
VPRDGQFRYGFWVKHLSATLVDAEDDGWIVVVPDVGQVAVADPRLADFECRRLLRERLGLDWAAVEDLDVRLVDGSGAPLYVFDLLCTGPVAPERVAALAAGPPAGCRFVDFDGLPGVRCVRPGVSRLAAVATLVAQLRDEYGIEADDLGFEKLWEWAGSRESRERLVAQLLLMATQRARRVGLPAEDLLEFVRTAMG